MASEIGGQEMSVLLKGAMNLVEITPHGIDVDGKVLLAHLANGLSIEDAIKKVFNGTGGRPPLTV